MKKFIIASFAAAAALLAFCFQAAAVPADPRPATVTQPDGSTITIRVHGDEFLNWTTCGDALVAKAADGFYHFATFDADGASTPSGSRVTSTPGGDGSAVKPPKSALLKAAATKSEWIKAAARIRNAASADGVVSGNDHFLVMLIDFNDLKFSVGDAHNAFNNMLNQEGYSEHNGTGSVRDYYSDQSTKVFQPQFDVCGPYTVKGNMSTYSESNGTTQNGAPRLLAEACQIADPDVDFSIYDHDHDGVIDNIFFYYAGYCASSHNPGTIWPHAWAVYYKTFTFDGVQLYRYGCASEYDGKSGSCLMASIGTFCHEFGHIVGLPDFYDTDYEENGEGYGLGYYSLMSAGSYNNNEKTPPYFSCEERKLLGWMNDAPSLPLKSKTVTLAPVQGNCGYVSPTDNDNEYYYYEYRNQTGWDKPLRPGLVIYHVDKSNNVVGGYTAAYRWTNWDGINDYADHQCYRLLLADENKEIVPFGGSYDKFTSTSKPSAKSWSGEATGYDLTQITHDGENASFYLTCANADLFDELGICAIETEGTWKAGDIFKLTLVEIENAPSSVIWYFDGEKVTADSVVLTSGSHTVKAELVWTNGDTGSYEAMINVL